MEEQNPFKRKTWCVRVVPHSTRSSSLEKREIYTAGLPKKKNKKNELQKGALPFTFTRENKITAGS
jgi:hypothetical protein